MGLLFNFSAYLVDSSENIIREVPSLRLGCPFGPPSPSLPSSNTTITNDYTYITSRFGGDTIIGSGLYSLQQNQGIETLNLYLPLIVPKATLSSADGSYYLKIVNDSGYYAVTQRPIGQYTDLALFDLFDDSGTMLSSMSLCGCFNRADFAMSTFIALTMTGDTITSLDQWRVETNSSNQKTYLVHISYGAGGAGRLAWFNGLITPPEEPTDPYDDIDGEGPIGGGSTVNIPGFPGLTASATGIIGLFAPTAAQMQQLAGFMWTNFGGTGTTTEAILSEIVEALKRSISNPLDYVLGLNIIPSQGLSIGAASVVNFGFVSSGVSMPRLTNQYFTVDCGSLFFDTVCGDTFLDYAPYSKFSIYLPYIGIQEVDANDFVGHTIGVLYHGDVVTGGLTAYITKDGSVMYQFSGSCALNIPLSSDNWGNTISAAINIATSVIRGGVAGGAAGVAKAAAEGAAAVSANPSLLSPQVAHSGAVSGSAGCMGVQYPFVIREAVRFHSTESFNTLTGYPSFYYRSLSDVSGYTKVLEMHLTSFDATQAEAEEVISLMKQGVIL